MTQPLKDNPRWNAAPAAAPGVKPAKPNDAKTLLTTLRMTTTIGAVSLTLVGWGLLAHAEGVRAAQDASVATQSFSGSAAALVAANTAAGGATPTTSPAQGVLAAQQPVGGTASTARAASGAAVLPTATPTPAATATATATSVPTVATATPAVQVKLNVVNWVTTQAGDPVAVVQDSSGVLWYVWGPDVTRIEQGLSPEYQPQAVNSVARSRGS